MTTRDPTIKKKWGARVVDAISRLLKPKPRNVGLVAGGCLLVESLAPGCAATNLNIDRGNQNMAHTLLKPGDSAKEQRSQVTAEPDQEQTLTQVAEDAFEMFVEYITNPSGSDRDALLQLIRENAGEQEFIDRFLDLVDYGNERFPHADEQDNPTNNAFPKRLFDSLGPVPEGQGTYLERFMATLTSAVDTCYEHLLDEDVTAEDRDGSAAWVAELGVEPEFVQALAAVADSMRTRGAIPSRSPEVAVTLGSVDEQVTDETLNRFLTAFGAEVDEDASREDRIRALGESVRTRFRAAGPRESSVFLQAAFRAYNLIGQAAPLRGDVDMPEAEEARRQFLDWIRNLNPGQRAGLRARTISAVHARDPNNTPDNAVRASFERHLALTPLEDRSVDDAMQRLERGHHSFIRRTGSERLLEMFVSTPTGHRLENLERRVRYARERARILERRIERDEGNPDMESHVQDDREALEALNTELDELRQALNERYGLEGDRAEDAIATLRGDLFTIERTYMNLVDDESGRSRFISVFESAADNRELFRLYVRHLELMDSAVLGLFSDLDAGDEPSEYIDGLRRIIRSDIQYSDVVSGRAHWLTGYHQPVVLSTGREEDADGGARRRVSEDPYQDFLYARVQRLDGLSALAFERYLETVGEIPFVSDEQRDQERRVVVYTVSRLFSVSPALVVRYFAAIRNLADICESNPETYIRALVELSANIDSQTQPILSATSPTQLSPINRRRIIMTLESALNYLADLSQSAFFRYARLELTDDLLDVDGEPPHVMRQRRPRYLQGFNPHDVAITQEHSTYPLPGHLNLRVRDTNLYMGNVAGGSVVNPDYEWDMRLPNPAQAIEPPDNAGLVGDSLEAYLNPHHSLTNIPGELPGTRIRTISLTRLLSEIDRAFISEERPEYGFNALGGSGAGRLIFEWPEASEDALTPEGDLSFGGGLLGSVVTDTGGISFGAAGMGDNVVAGGVAVGIPLARIRAPRDGGTEEVGLDSLIAGYELDDETHEVIVNALSTIWSEDNPGELIIGVNYSQDDEEQQSYSTMRVFYIDREGTIVELLGGTNSVVDMLNYQAGRINIENENFPTTFIWNVEPTVPAGGGAVAADIGPASVLGHFQLVPFLTREGETAPTLYQWTVGYSHNVERGEEGRDIWRVQVPGQYMESQGDGFFLQDMGLTFRRMEREDNAWELSGGAGLGYADAEEQEREIIGRAGAFFRVQRPNWRLGGGASYEGGSTNLEALGLLEDAEGTQEYLRSLHRVALTAYGSRTIADRYVLGGFANVIAQFQGSEFDEVFGRFIGLLSFVESHSGIRIEYSRSSGLDRILTGYQRLRRDVSRNPNRANDLTREFMDEYIDNARQIYDRYSLAVRVNDDFSFEGRLLAREAEQDFTRQRVSEAQMSFLYTFNSGFWRGFATIPVEGPFAASGARGMGLVGSGIGFGPFNRFLNRVAVDGGVILSLQREAQEQLGEDVELEDVAGFQYGGWFLQGALRLYSDYLTDSGAYVTLVRNYQEYAQAIRAGDFSELPEPVRQLLLDNLPDELVADLANAIEDAEDDIAVEEDASDELQSILYLQWFVPRENDLREEFRNRLRIDLAGSGYIFDDGGETDVAGDLAAYVQFAGDLGRVFAIASWRPETGDVPTIYGGLTIRHRNVEVTGTMGGGPEGIGGSVSGSVDIVRGRIPIRFTTLVSGGTLTVPEYTAPLLRFHEEQRDALGFDIMFFVTVGESGLGPISPDRGPRSPLTTGSGFRTER